MDWFIADTHFGDVSSVKFIPRPILEMVSCTATNAAEIRKFLDELIIKNLQKLPVDDTLYHLGDVGNFENIMDAKEIVSKIPCKSILVMGNHDMDSSCVSAVTDEEIELFVEFWQEAGFNFVYNRPMLYNPFTTISHEPPMHTNFPRFSIFGHIHSNPTFRTISTVSCCVSTERWLFRPIPVDEILAQRMSRQARALRNNFDPDIANEDVILKMLYSDN